MWRDFGLQDACPDSWRDSSGALHRPNSLIHLDLPTLHVTGQLWMVNDVTYRRGPDGALCDILIMPPEAFAVQPTLPRFVLPIEFAQRQWVSQ